MDIQGKIIYKNGSGMDKKSKIIQKMSLGMDENAPEYVKRILIKQVTLLDEDENHASARNFV